MTRCRLALRRADNLDGDKADMSKKLQMRSSQEEFESLVSECRSLQDLSRAEDLIQEGLMRLGRSLMSETVQQVADAEPEEPPSGAFPP